MNLHPIVLPFVILANAVVAVKGTYLQNGKLNISQTFEQWSCNSGCTPSYHCRLPRCTSVAFPKTFSGSEKVQVHVSLSHGEEFSRVHSPSAMWVRSITTRGFDVCVRETGSARNESGVINWVAFQDNPGMIRGSLVFSGIWTTETKCNKVDFSQGFGLGPYVFVSAKYNRDTQPNDAMYVWLENVKRGSFEVCIREFLPFDGQHQNAIVDWFAFDGNGSDLNFTLMGEAGFENRNTPKVEDNYGFCQDVQFNTTFYASPVVLVSVHHYYNRQQKNLILPENNIVTAWVEEIRLTSMTICVKDLSGTGSKHDPLSVYYVVIGDIDPCLGVNCPSFGICKTFSAHESRCVCHEDCPSYQDPVCTTNGTTYDNHCWYKLNYCKGLEKNSVYHPGSCVGFPIVRDKVELRVPRWSDSSCQTVVFPPYHFYPEKLVQVQITVTHMNLNDSERVHDAVTSWIEDTNTENFTVCAMQSGRRSRNFNPFATIVWVAYQGAPPNGMTGIIKMQKWWSGTKCADVTFSKDKFKSTPVVLVTAEHLRTGVEYDAALIWTEDATKDSFKVCLREMQNFDGKHEDINVNWMAFTDLDKPFFKERGFVKFPNTNPPLDENNNAYCQFVLFAKSYNSTPSVLVTANHRTDNGNSAPVHNGITAWIESMNSTGFRPCLKELYETRYEPVSLSYVVLTNICEPGWSYFNGHCYFTSKTCANWTTALRNCRNENSAIADVESSEENVFIQHRHNGEKSWLGLNDRSSEGNFTWVDRGRGNFTAWANNQPNNFKEEDCVHALGIKYRYEWNDVKCSDCHKYTCKKDLDECNTNLDACNRKASCNNTEGSYTCLCDNPYQGDGFDCSSTLGLYSSNPAHSCKEMRDLGLSRKNGRYWIDPEKNGNPLKVFCDMTTDGGGWLLVSEVVVDSSNQRFPFSVESSYRGISKSQMFLSNNAMQQLRQHLSFTQLRFYCQKQRTFHVMTTANSAGEAVVQFFSYQTNTMPLSCGSYVKMADDNSYLAGQCSRWGYDNAYFVGKWGHLGLGNTARLCDHPLFVGLAYHFLLSPNGGRWECDDYNVGVSSGNSWKVFIR